jgi:hypothetical protein
MKKLTGYLGKSGIVAIVSFSLSAFATFYAIPMAIDGCAGTGCEPNSLTTIQGPRGSYSIGDANTNAWLNLYMVFFWMQWGGGIVGTFALLARLSGAK